MAVLISIITINLDNKIGLEQTLNSVHGQSFKDFEHILIDGGSTDGSVEVLRSASQFIKYWISEPDTGIYNAMNKGISNSNGVFCLFLNSGDRFSDQYSLNRLLSCGTDYDIIFGNLLMQSKSISAVKKYSPLITFNTFYSGQSLPHPSSLIRKSLFDFHGLYREDFNFVSDWDFFLKVALRPETRFKYIDSVISVFDVHGRSADFKNAKIQDTERAMVLQSYFLYLPDYARLNFLEHELSEIKVKLLFRLLIKFYHSSVMHFLRKIKHFLLK